MVLEGQGALARGLSSILRWSNTEMCRPSWKHPAFPADARSLGLSDGERLAIVTWTAANPQAGDVMEGTGGARKVRFAGKARGKAGATG